MRFLLGLTRTLVALAMGLWIGGLAFFGIITAGIMFRMTREAGAPEMAPKMVGPMLSRFAIICTICSIILIVGWLVDGLLTKRNLWWRLQGGLTIVAVALGVYLNFGLLPAVQRAQPAALPLYVRSLTTTLTPQETEVKARFDSGHNLYKGLASINIWIVVAALACLMARSIPADLGLEPLNRRDTQAG